MVHGAHTEHGTLRVHEQYLHVAKHLHTCARAASTARRGGSAPQHKLCQVILAAATAADNDDDDDHDAI